MYIRCKDLIDDNVAYKIVLYDLFVCLLDFLVDFGHCK